MQKKKFTIGLLLVIGISLFSFLLPLSAGTDAVFAAGLNGYTVQKGDSLFLIAKKYNTTVENLKTINALKTDMIYPGQVLSIPGGIKYTVKAGDTLYLIAKNFGVSVEGLKLQNTLKSDMIYPGQVLVIPDNTVKPLKTILAENGLLSSGSKLDILVDKSDHTLSILSQGKKLKTYHVELGDGGTGDKQIAGDHKTPEGTFYIAQKSVLSPVDPYLGSRWMRLSYPNIEDADRGLQQGLIDTATHDTIVSAINNVSTPPQRTALGGGVGIHGGTTPELGSDWTWGCVGLTNKDVEDFYDFVSVGTKVIIQK